MIGTKNKNAIESLRIRLFNYGRIESLMEKETQYCIDDCDRCKNDDCLFGRKKKGYHNKQS